MTETSPLKDFAQSVKVPAELIKAAGEPPAQELGQGLADIMYLIFSPIKKWRASAEANVEKYKVEIANELNKIDPEKRTDPKLSVAGPALEASKFYIEEDELRRMFAKLIAASANTDYKDGAIPSFVEVIKQMSSFDAKNLKELKEIEVNKPQVAAKIKLLNSDTGTSTTLLEDYIPLAGFNGKNFNDYAVSLDNLQRLGLIKIQYDASLANKQFYEDLKNLVLYKDAVSELAELKEKGESYYLPREIKMTDGSWDFTNFGKLFIKCCLD